MTTPTPKAELGMQQEELNTQGRKTKESQGGGKGPGHGPILPSWSTGDNEVVLVVNYEVDRVPAPCLYNPQAQLVAKPVISGWSSAEAQRPLQIWL